MVRVSGIRPTSLVDGEGIRFTIFLTGCIHNCPGCHSPETQNYYTGTEMSEDEIISTMQKYIGFIDGITLSGGDPLYQLKGTKSLLKKIRENETTRNLNIWLYTGYDITEIPGGIRQYVDVIIDGKYDKSKPAAKFRGSNNQKIWKKFKGTNKFIDSGL